MITYQWQLLFQLVNVSVGGADISFVPPLLAIANFVAGTSASRLSSRPECLMT